MKKILHYIIIGVTSLLTFASCDVHEFPEDNQELVPFLLHLDFNTEMPIYDVVTRGSESATKAQASKYDVRYTINAYRTNKTRNESRVADATFVFTKSDVSDLNFTAPLELPEGTYTFRVWADYVDAGSKEDKYYDTHDFEEVILANKKNHPGSNDYRDAFRGYTTATVTNPKYYYRMEDVAENKATAEMIRPLGKFKLISTDVDGFLNRVHQMLKDKGVILSSNSDNDIDFETNTKAAYEKLMQRINFGDYYAVIKYAIFMPCSFNMFTDKPAEVWEGMSFKSPLIIDENNEICIGFDYVFVNGSSTTLSISLEVYNGDNELVSSTNGFDVPIVRSKLTIVKGNFLTSKATGGVSINPGYEGKDFDIDITIR